MCTLVPYWAVVIVGSDNKLFASIMLAFAIGVIYFYAWPSVRDAHQFHTALKDGAKFLRAQVRIGPGHSGSPADMYFVVVSYNFEEMTLRVMSRRNLLANYDESVYPPGITFNYAGEPLLLFNAGEPQTYKIAVANDIFDIVDDPRPPRPVSP